jgi:selenide,water dikinase
MLPGFIRGYYTFDESHIDLRRVALFSGAEFIQDDVVAIHPDESRLVLSKRGALQYDLLSLNLGSTPTNSNIPGATEFAVPVKPVPKFLAHWNEICQIMEGGSTHKIIVVGGGAGGVEVALNIKQRFADVVEVQILHSGDSLLTDHTPGAKELVLKALASSGVKYQIQRRVAEVSEGEVVCENGERHTADTIFWTTNASPPPFFGDSGLQIDDRGFVLIDETFRSISHPTIFAAGDNASFVKTPRPKSGVFAVRAARPLFENLQCAVLGKPGKPFVPQRSFLSLIGTGDKKAIASRGSFSWHSQSLWTLKDWIDRRFMRKLQDLPVQMEGGVSESPPSHTESPDLQALLLQSQLRCTGCAAKVGATVLSRVFERLGEEFPEVLLPDEHAALGSLRDDAAVLRHPPGDYTVQTVDYFPAFISDNFTLGQVAVAHCLSDLHAMGAKPYAVLALALLPFSAEAIAGNRLEELLRGVCTSLREESTILAGGHTAEGESVAIGLSCLGGLKEKSLLSKGNIAVGDVFILTKPLGTGVLFAAQMRGATKGRWIDSALEQMVRTNRVASEVFRSHQVSACTDVTGFGLAGHLFEMINGSDGAFVAQLELGRLPSLSGVAQLIQSGYQSSLFPQNVKCAKAMEFSSNSVGSHPLFSLLFDPQTSGGLLAAVAQEKAQACLEELHVRGVTEAVAIGEVKAGTSEKIFRVGV